MTGNEKTLTTSEYAKKTGLAASTVARMLREGKLRGEKHGRKWAIPANELENSGVENGQPDATAPSSPPPVSNSPSSSAKTYDIEAFSRLTYLTKKGVRQWIKDGRLTGTIDSVGNLKVDAANLQRADFKHLVR
jgi:excisionase family DNA binding protein